MSKKKKDPVVVDENIADEVETIEIETADISSDENESLKEDESIEECFRYSVSINDANSVVV